MKQILLALVFVCAGHGALAQKIDVKKDKITVDDADYATIEKDGCGALSPSCAYYINSTDGKRLITVTSHEFKDPDAANAGNPDGRVLYLQFSFNSYKPKAETKYPSILGLKAIDVAKLVVKGELIKDGQLDMDAVGNFVNTCGTAFSDRKKELAQPDVIIIEK